MSIEENSNVLKEDTRRKLDAAGFPDVSVFIGYFRHQANNFRMEVRLNGTKDRVAEARKLLALPENDE